MNKIVGLLFMVVGIALVIVGINGTESFASDVSRFFTGTPTEKSVWMLIGGIALAVIGLFFSGRSAMAVPHK